jgi:hypothetical protein
VGLRVMLPVKEICSRQAAKNAKKAGIR